MRIPRVFQAVELSLGSTIELNAEACHYLTRVLRLRHHAPITIFNGKGGEYQARLIIANKNNCLAEILAFLDMEFESPLKIHLGQGIARGDKMDFIIQKAVELGITELSPIITEFCNLSFDTPRADKKQQHWQAIAIHGCEQCHRNRIPSIYKPALLSQWFNQLPPVDLRLILDPQASDSLPHLRKKIPTLKSIQLVIGPEGGLSEREQAIAHQFSFIPVNLGHRILRTETASLAALALLQGLWGDF